MYSTQDDRSEQYMLMGLSQRGHEVVLVCAPGAHFHMPLAEAGISINFLQTRNRLDFRAMRGVRKILKRERPDVIYAPRNATLSVALFATVGLGVPVVAYRGTMGHIHYTDPASWLTYLHPRLAHIHCVSEAVRRHLDEDLHISTGKLSCIYKGHKLAWYASEQAPTSWSDSFGIPADAFVVVFTGNIRPVKGVDVLLDAVRDVPVDSRMHLILIGEIRDKHVQRMVEMPGIRDRVHCLGFRRDAAKLVGAADVFVMPSVEREGLPRAVIEAMAQAIPVVVSDVGGMPELVEDSESGLVVPPRDSIRLRKALLKLEHDSALRERLGLAAKQRIGTAFDIDATISAMEALFSKIAAQSG
jgi:glycosyltransferase involved in cell wall biosynthesis